MSKIANSRRQLPVAVFCVSGNVAIGLKTEGLEGAVDFAKEERLKEDSVQSGDTVSPSDKTAEASS